MAIYSAWTIDNLAHCRTCQGTSKVPLLGRLNNFPPQTVCLLACPYHAICLISISMFEQRGMNAAKRILMGVSATCTLPKESLQCQWKRHPGQPPTRTTCLPLQIDDSMRDLGVDSVADRLKPACSRPSCSPSQFCRLGSALWRDTVRTRHFKQRRITCTKPSVQLHAASSAPAS